MHLRSMTTHTLRHEPRDNAPAQLQGRALRLARAAWLCLALSSLALFLLNLSYAFQARRIVCNALTCAEEMLSPSTESLWRCIKIHLISR
jgi:hypothetical protein